MKKTVLVASHDPHLADVRRHVLEGAGYRVIPAASHPEVAEACQSEKIHLVVVGYSLPPAEKRLVSFEARQHCKVSILELYNNEPPALQRSSYTHHHHSETPEDFLDAVNALLRPSTRL